MAPQAAPNLTAHLRNTLWRSEETCHTITLAKSETERSLIASERIATLGRMVSGIMHEINNPLDALGMNLYMLRQLAPSPEQQVYLDRAQKMLDQVVRISQNALQFSRHSETASQVSILQIIKEVHELYECRIRKDGIVVNVNSDMLSSDVIGYVGDLRQLFANVFRNALDAAGKGGSVTVRVRRGRSHVRVVIADSGSGISPIVRCKLGQPFFTTKGDSGTGLGLWISNQIVQKHGGTMRVRNGLRKSCGAVFHIFLPLKAALTVAA